MFSGNVTFEQAKDYAEKFFGSWKVNQTTPRPVTPTAGTWKPTTVVVDMPEAGQASVSVTKPAIKRDSPDYYAGLVANAALGNGFGSRLNREIRIKRGLSYGARSSLDTRRDAGAFTASAQTKNESAAEVATLLQTELKRFATEPVQGDELKSRQALLTGSYARSMSAQALDSLPPERLFDFHWATTVAEQALRRLREECENKGRLRLFRTLSSHLTAERDEVSYANLATTLGIAETAVKKQLHNLRQRYRSLLRDEVANTVADPAEVEDEIRYLCSALAAGTG